MRLSYKKYKSTNSCLESQEFIRKAMLLLTKFRNLPIYINKTDYNKVIKLPILKIHSQISVCNMKNPNRNSYSVN